MEELDLSKEIKEVFLKFESKLVVNSIKDFKNKVSSDNTFFNRSLYGNSIKILDDYLKSKEIIYITYPFICCENGIILIDKKKNIFSSRGFFEFNKSIDVWYPKIQRIHPELGKSLYKVIYKEELLKKEQERLQEEQRIKELKVSQVNVLSELDKDGNGEVDVVEGDDFNKLLKKHQKRIVDIDRNYVQQFVKVSSYLKIKKGNIQSIFNSIKDTPNQEVLNEYVDILKDEIHVYNLVLFNSLNMIVSLVEDEMITFYEIHEMFDNLNIFDSKHEKDVSQRLTNIGDGLESLMYEIRDMGNQISDSVQELSYVTEESNRQLDKQLSEIDSSIKTNNLLTGIQTYQMYKINKNTKSLRG